MFDLPPPAQPSPYVLTGFPEGVDNIHPEYALPATALQDGVNIDLFDSGDLRRRKGSSKQVTLVGSHSNWSDPKNPRPSIAYYVAGTTLYSVTETKGVFTSIALATGLAVGRKVAYLYLNGDVFWSNGLISGRIRAGVNVPWGVESPARSPTLTAGVTGGLYAGKYQVVLTYRNSTGEEGGADKAVVVDVLTNGSIALSGIPAPISTDVTQICVYVSAANGEMLHLVARLSSTATAYTITTVANATTVLKTQFLDPMPAGDRIAHLGGIIYVAAGNVVYHSEPYRYGLCNINENFYQYPAPVDEILAVPDEAGLRPEEGLYVCSDRTYFILRAGTPEAEQKIIFPFGAIRGTGTYLPNSPNVIWFSSRGQVVGGLAGKAELKTAAKYRPGVMSTGTSLVREKNGLRQIINTVQQTGIDPLEYIG